MHFETRAIHDGQAPDPRTGSVAVPVYQTSTYQQDAIGQHRGYEYSRTGNPTRAALETCLASLEQATHGFAFASGVAATTAVLQALLKPGDHLVAGDDLYGGTYRLFEHLLVPWGVTVSYVDATDPDRVRDAMTPQTRLIWIETPTNPLLKLADISALAAVASAGEAYLAVDNTFASPVFQTPLSLGADLVVHSATKYLGGHSDLVAGAVMVADPDLAARIGFWQNAAGAVPGPWDCWLLLRGLKTLAIRMREHEHHALRIAKALAEHPAVKHVYYPGLPAHAQYDLACKQMSGFSGMVSIELAGGWPAVERFVAKLKLFTLGESLGGVESLVCHPARMTHAALSDDARQQRGISDALVRLSVGIEQCDDLWADLQQALDF